MGLARRGTARRWVLLLDGGLLSLPNSGRQHGSAAIAPATLAAHSIRATRRTQAEGGALLSSR